MYLSDTTPYNSYNGIYPQRLLTTIIQEIQFLTTYNYDFIINKRYYNLQLETALCYQHYFCNTELRTAIITKMKGLSIQAQQNMFVLFTLFKLTLDECKTLTKISTCKPLTTVPQTSTHLGHEGTRKPANHNLRRKAFCNFSFDWCIFVKFILYFSYAPVINNLSNITSVICVQ